MLPFVLFLSLVSALQDLDYKACWDIQLQDEDMFCYGAVNWPISEEIYYNATSKDEEAKQMYRGLLFKWYNRTGNLETATPSNDCLAIARSVYCAVTFPKCVDHER